MHDLTSTKLGESAGGVLAESVARHHLDGMALCLFQFVFSVETVFFSHNKSAGTIFQFIFSAKQTGPMEGPCSAPLNAITE